MPRCSSAYRAARGKSLPTTPTTCTGWRMDPATLKNTAEPPSASAVSPNGVATESRATDPTTKSDTLHPVRGADAHEREAVRQHLTYGASQHEPRRLLRLAEHAVLVIPRVDDPGQPLEVACDAVRLERGGGARHEARKVGELLQQEQLFRLVQRREMHTVRRGGLGRPPGAAEDAAQAGVRHLDVEDGVLLGLALGEVHIEHEVRVSPAHQEEVAHRVAPHLVDQLAHGHVTAGALGDLHLRAALHYRHHLVQHVLRVARRAAELERLQPDADASDRALMAGALDADRPCEAPLPFVDVIGDVREEIGVLAAFFHPLAHHAVLIVPEVGRLEPERAVLLVGMPRPHQPTQRLLDLAGRVQGRLEKVDVERDAQGLQVRVLLLAELLHRKPPHVIEVGTLWVAGMGGEVALGDVADVLTVIATLWKGGGAATQLSDPRLHTPRQLHDLGAAIVVIEFARDAPPRPVEQRRDRIAQRGLPAVAYVQRTGGIGRDELDVHGPALAGVLETVLAAGEEEVDEPRSRDVDLANDALGKLERRDQALGHR